MRSASGSEAPPILCSVAPTFITHLDASFSLPVRRVHTGVLRANVQRGLGTRRYARPGQGGGCGECVQVLFERMRTLREFGVSE